MRRWARRRPKVLLLSGLKYTSDDEVRALTDGLQAAVGPDELAFDELPRQSPFHEATDDELAVHQ